MHSASFINAAIIAAVYFQAAVSASPVPATVNADSGAATTVRVSDSYPGQLATKRGIVGRDGGAHHEPQDRGAPLLASDFEDARIWKRQVVDEALGDVGGTVGDVLDSILGLRYGDLLTKRGIVKLDGGALELVEEGAPLLVRDSEDTRVLERDLLPDVGGVLDGIVGDLSLNAGIGGF